MARNLRPEAGGDPKDQGPVPELTDHLPSDVDDLPGASGRPDSDTDDRPQDRPDLDAFAARMGTDRIGTGGAPSDDDDGSRSTAPSASTRVRSIAAGSLRGLSRGSGAVASGLDRLARRIG